MVGITNAGATRAIAFINCTYPVGSSCTASAQGITIMATGSSGAYTFKLPRAGTWTLSITDGTSEVSTDVNVAPWTAVDVELSYTLIPEDLRSTYFEVEYTNFSGNGVIGSGINSLVTTGIVNDGQSNYDVELEFTPSGISSATDANYAIIANEGIGNMGYDVQGILVRGGKFILSHGCPPAGSEYYATGPSVVNGQKYTLKVHYTQISGTYKMYIDGAERASIASSNALHNDSSFSFGTSYVNYYGTAKGKYGKGKIWRGSTLVGHMVPCVRRSDSACGFLNIIDKTFHFNVDNGGTTPGSATPGPAV